MVYLKKRLGKGKWEVGFNGKTYIRSINRYVENGKIVESVKIEGKKRILKKY